MKLVLSILILIFLFFNLSAQIKDSVKISAPVRKDTVNIKDSLTRAHADSLRDTTKVKRLKPLIPIYRQALTSPAEYNNIIRPNEILYNVYRYAGDLLKFYPLTFERSLGITGQPNEVLVYGSGFNQASFLRNGFLLNNRLTNSFDLNNIQSEIIDSIEIVPSTRGFLYGNFNNNASVNFVTKFKFVPDTTRGPYSRVRFYQAPDDEAMIDFIYSSKFSRRLNVTLDISNRTSSLRYVKTINNTNADAYGIWQGTARFRYFLSDKFNIIGTYRYLKSETKLFGGVNVDSTLKLYNSANFDTLYSLSNLVANYADRYQKVTNREYNIELLGITAENLKSELSLYYNFNQIEFRQYVSEEEKVPLIFDNNKYNLYGISTRHSYESQLIGLDVSAGYEITDYKADVIKQKDKVNSLYLSGRMLFNLPGKIFVPSVFAKYLSYNKNSIQGYGADISMNLVPGTQLYAGISHFNRPLNIYENYYIDKYSLKKLSANDLRQVTSFEIGSKYVSKFLYADLSLFHRQTQNDVLTTIAKDTLNSLSYINNKILGAGLKMGVSFWKINIDLYPSYYLVKQNDNANYSLPRFTLNGGIYYRDILFDSNLDLKAGIRGVYTGKQDFISYDFERNMTGPAVIPGSVPAYLTDRYKSVKPSYNVDLVVVGEIRKAAIVFLSYENVFGSNYYIVPFYPMYQSGLMFGISWAFLN